jgi:hypothetical protein
MASPLETASPLEAASPSDKIKNINKELERKVKKRTEQLEEQTLKLTVANKELKLYSAIVAICPHKNFFMFVNTLFVIMV